MRRIAAANGVVRSKEGIENRLASGVNMDDLAVQNRILYSAEFGDDAAKCRPFQRIAQP
jgi:hypothetical protein